MTSFLHLDHEDGLPLLDEAFDEDNGFDITADTGCYEEIFIPGDQPFHLRLH